MPRFSGVGSACIPTAANLTANVSIDSSSGRSCTRKTPPRLSAIIFAAAPLAGAINPSTSPRAPGALLPPEAAAPLVRNPLRRRLVGEDHQPLYELPRLGRTPRRRPCRNAVLVKLVLEIGRASCREGV